MTLNMQELYWAAGFLEGEGSFQSSATRNHKWGNVRLTWAIQMSAAQVNPEPLERLKTCLGGNYVQVKRNNTDGIPRKDIFVWRLSGKPAAGAMMILWTLMSRKRQGQIEQSLNRWKTNRSRSQAMKEHWIWRHEQAAAGGLT